MDDLSSIGESFFRPWSDDMKSQKSMKSNRSPSSHSRSKSRSNRSTRSGNSKSSGRTLKRSGSGSRLDIDGKSSKSSKREKKKLHRKSKSFSDLEGQLGEKPKSFVERSIAGSEPYQRSKSSRDHRSISSSTRSKSKSRRMRSVKEKDPPGGIDPPA